MIDKMRFRIGKKTIKFIRFCKIYNLYDIISKKFNNVYTLSSTLGMYNVENYMKIFISNKDGALPRHLCIGELTKLWYDFANDIIEEDIKNRSMASDLYKYFIDNNLTYQLNSLYGYGNYMLNNDSLYTSLTQTNNLVNYLYNDL